MALHCFSYAVAILEASLICPTGKSPKSLSSPFAENIPLGVRPDSNLYPPPSCPTQRGVTRTSRTSGRDAVDAAVRETGAACWGRRSRVVLTPRRWCQVGGQPLTTVAKEPGHRGEREV